MEYKNIMNNIPIDNIDLCNANEALKLLHGIYSCQYRCVNIDRNIWYKFSDHRWKLTDFSNLIEDILDDFEENVLLKNSPFIRNIIISNKQYFYDPDFLNVLDSYPYLIGFENGIYDLKKKCFRDGKPDDYVSLTTGYDYVDLKKIDVNNIQYYLDIYSEINEFFNKIMVDTDMKEYLLTTFASYLDGNHSYCNMFQMWTGIGSNGKSSCVNFLGYAFGEYFAPLPTTSLCKKINKNKIKDLIDKSGKRILVVQEPEHDDVIFFDNIRLFTNNSYMDGVLHGIMFKYIPQFALLLICNKVPIINEYRNYRYDCDDILNKIAVVPWNSQFVKGEPTSCFQFKKDNNLDEKIKLWSPVFMWMLINKYYPLYSNNYGVSTPSQIKFCTKKYIDERDIFGQYLDRDWVITRNDEDKVMFFDLYVGFKCWHVIMSDKIPLKKDFIDYLTNSGLKIIDNFVCGIKPNPYDFDEISAMNINNHYF